ncbi:hypothetical protein K7432_013024 [Basidiobolus ranarum]|uniref:Uncharacterized protein n=1 Tax=Basidiobolus ranarum TaxID=34480 RepID=A0ABR2WK01_9FUNG
MANSTHHFIPDLASPWRVSKFTDPLGEKNQQISDSLGSSFTDDHDSEIEYWGRYGYAPTQDSSRLEANEETSGFDDYWAQYDGMGTETPPLHEDSCKQSTMNTTISYEAPVEFISDMRPEDQIPVSKPNSRSLDLAFVLTQRLENILFQEKEKEKIMK